MSSLYDAYLAGAAGAFFNGHYADAADRRRALQRARRPLAPAVASALAAQNACFTPSSARALHIGQLLHGAPAVVTGQQVGLFLGPLFTLYKAASAVAVARALAAESGEPVVPVFWLQTEDHDLAEIAVTHVPCAIGDPLPLRLPASPAQRISLAHCLLPDDVELCLDQLRAQIGNLPHADEHLIELARHYLPGAGWSEAFAGLLADLFCEEGLVLIDARDPALAQATVPIHRRALTGAASIAAALAARTQSLIDAGFAATVHVRPGAPLSFFHPQGAQGPRFRLDAEASDAAKANAYTIKGRGTFELDALLAALDADPFHFSTSALLRPILQDSWLPTAAYVAGPGEVAYAAQLAPIYATFDLPMPLIVPRAHFRLLEAKTRRLLARLRITADDMQGSEDHILRNVGPVQPTSQNLVDALIEPFQATLQELAPQLEAAGPGLHRAVEKTRATVAAAVAKLAGKYESACLHHDQQLVAEVRQAKQLLYPHGVPQERFYGFSYFAARHGGRAFVTRVLDGIVPFDPTPRDLYWDDVVSS